MEQNETWKMAAAFGICYRNMKKFFSWLFMHTLLIQWKWNCFLLLSRNISNCSSLTLLFKLWSLAWHLFVTEGRKAFPFFSSRFSGWPNNEIDIQQVNRRKKKTYNFMHKGIPKIWGSLTCKLRLTRHPELRRKVWCSWASKGRKTIQGGANVWWKNVSLAVRRSLSYIKNKTITKAKNNSNKRLSLPVALLLVQSQHLHSFMQLRGR